MNKQTYQDTKAESRERAAEKTRKAVLKRKNTPEDRPAPNRAYRRSLVTRRVGIGRARRSAETAINEVIRTFWKGV